MERELPSTAQPLKLLIADDQPLIRRALAITLADQADIEIVGQVADGQEAIEMAARLAPDVVIMDLKMPRVSGVVATREISTRQPQTRIIVLTTFDHDDLVFDAILAGAQAYLLKDATEDEVLETIHAVHRGESRLSPSIARKVLAQFRQLSEQRVKSNAGLAAAPDLSHRRMSSPVAEHAPAYRSDPLEEEPLTDKEQRVLDLIAQGASNKQIANTVFLAEGTVKNYVSRIMDKLHARNRIELAVRAAARRD